LLIVAGAVVVLVGAVLAFEWSGDFSTAGLEDTIRSLGAWGVLASIALMIVHSFVPFPAEFVALANGMVYGPLWGTVITWVGAMLGASIAFWLARRLGRPFVERMVSRNDWRVLDDWAAVNGWQVVLISRFIPVIAFNLINYAAGLTGVVMGDNVESLGWESWLALLIGGAVLWLLLRQKLRTRQPTLTSGGKR
jgi:uncharacterized membrane protein YdjX (TVP38/TMEM64 family)